MVKCALLLNGWMSTPNILVTGGLKVLVKIRKIKQKYFKIIKAIHIDKFNNQGFINSLQWFYSGYYGFYPLYLC